MSATVVADLNLSVLNVGEETGEPSTLGAFRDGKKLVLDFWHTRCTNCPNALTKLDGVAAKHPEVRFAACALSLGSKTEGTQEQVLELLDGMWENLTHLYMPFEDKEKAKEEKEAAEKAAKEAAEAAAAAETNGTAEGGEAQAEAGEGDVPPSISESEKQEL